MKEKQPRMIRNSGGPDGDRAGEAAGAGGRGPVDPFPPRATTTQRSRVGTPPRVTGTMSAVVGGPRPPAPAASPARLPRAAFTRPTG